MRILFLLILITVTAFSEDPEKKPLGFGDYVKDPDAWNEMVEHRNRLDNLKLPEKVTDAMIRDWVANIVSKRNDPVKRRYLDLLGKRSVPYLLEALKDKKLYQTPEEDAFLGDSPYEQVLALLVPHAPDSSIPLIASNMDHKDDDVRGATARYLASLGQDACIAPVKKALRDKGDYVSGDAVEGISKAITAKRATPKFKAAMFESLSEMVDADKMGFVFGDHIKALVAIDLEKAKKILLSKKYFRVGNPHLNVIVEAIPDAISSDKLLDLIKETKGAVGSETSDLPYVFKSCLLLLAKRKRPEAKALCAEIQAWPEKRRAQMSSTIAECTLIFAGLENVWGVMDEKLKKQGWEKLAAPIKYCIAVDALDGQVKNGGFRQYYFNSYGGDRNEALAGLKAMGLKKMAGILSRSIAVFGADGPSLNRQKRQLQLSKLTKEQDKSLSDLDGEWYDCDGELELAMVKYIIRNKKRFTAK